MRLDRDASILEHYVIDELASQAGGYFPCLRRKILRTRTCFLMFASSLVSDTIRLLPRKRLLSKK